MTERDIYTQRLVQFADHIASNKEPECPIFQKGELVILKREANPITIGIEYRWDIFECLPDIFDSWFWEEKSGNPKWEDDHEESTMANLFDFFNLSIDQFCICFDVKTNAEKYNYKKLNYESTRGDIANNIVEMVRRKESDF